MNGRLQLDRRFHKELKGLLFEILFSGKKLDDLGREHRHIDGKKFFLNSDKFGITLSETKGNNIQISDKHIDKAFDEFLMKLTRIPCIMKENENTK